MTVSFASFVRDRRGTVAAAVTGVLALSGLACIGIAATHQDHAPQPALSAAQPSVTATPTPSVTTVGPILPTSLPLKINIPAIHVSSVVQQVGKNSDGSLQVPAPGPRYDQPGWYRYSPTPGAVGPAVIVGHLDSAKNGPSVFWNLGRLHEGDTITISRADGSTAIFAVDSVQRFRKTSFPTQLVYGDTDNAALRLVTCGGAISRSTGHYVDNIVVLASMVRTAGGPPTAAA